ncbi:hypothetical protein THRCLA_20162 [Thraustotheca clavata]|uniref:Uncharacterized protein n=1 Tax=Thraustotheca clavata TaxID=74557 RepID=A0A1W0ABK8_9STRA|nr:hypothetical protein THRCLA_20162 [Thraustotheca clavata]
MPILLRRNAPRPSVDELVDPVGMRETTKVEIRRGSMPAMPIDAQKMCDECSGVCLCDVPLPGKRRPKNERLRASTYSMIVNNPSMVNSLANELRLLPKTYLRYALERVMSSAQRTISCMRRNPPSNNTKPSSSTATTPSQSIRNST